MQSSTVRERSLGREYELVYILQPQVDPDEADKIAKRIVDVVDKQGGKITKVDQWGKRRLAYTITRFTRGIFVYVRFAGIGNLVAEIERNLRNMDAVIRFQTIRVEGLTVDLDAIAVDPDAVKFERVEQSPEADEPEPSFEERLGLAPRHRDRDRDHSDDDDSSDDDDDDDDIVPGSKAKPAAAEVDADDDSN